MAPKQAKKQNKVDDQGEKKKDDKGGKKNDKGKEKKFIKKRCGPPIATGTVMVQRVLPPTVCCPPSGCSTFRGCLPGPGCRPC